jgi:CDP-diacylglycerol---glycerol-3-phosphate 3-phosphatidyltransferase
MSNDKSIAVKENIVLRKRIQLLIYRLLNPVVNFLIKKDIAPNAVTTVGLFLYIGVAAIFIIGAESRIRTDLAFVGWAGLLILIAGLLDMIDGQVARKGKSVSKFGALYDSVLDRYSELIMFLGICYYLVSFHYFFSSIMAFIALIGSMMVSYVRARAESLGFECNEGLMQRPERIIILGSSAMICGIASEFLGDNYRLYIPGIPFHIFETISIFTLPIAALAVLSNYTALKRMFLCRKQIEK